MASLTDVAREAGVSVAAASAVLNGSKGSVRVGEASSRRVREAARRLQYVPNYHMRSVRRGRSDTLGFLLEIGNVERALSRERLGSFYHHALSDGAESAAQIAGCNLLTIRPNVRYSAIEQGQRSLLQRRIDALVFPAASTSRRVHAFLADPPEMPIATIAPTVPTVLPSVVFDEQAGQQLCLSHLAELGHRRLLWLGPRVHGLPRAQSFQALAQEAGLAAELLLYPGPTIIEPRDDTLLCELAEQALSARLAEPRTFTALVCYNDGVAAGALRSLYRTGLKVPADVSVIGMDDDQARWTFPPLTSVDHRLYDMGRRAGELAMEMVEGGVEAIHALRGRVETITPTLVVRQSTGPAPRED